MLAASASAQVKVIGRVIDLQNKPVSDVIVKLVSGSKTLAFTSSNVQGQYVLELKEVPKSEVMLLFNHISYEKVGRATYSKEHFLEGSEREGQSFATTRRHADP